MKILSVDTSTMISSCSVMDNGIIIGDYNVNQELTHSETLVPMIKELLQKLNINLSEIDLYAVTKGPGSFTGLRIGMTVIKTFAQVYNKNIVGISTLEALANQIISNDMIIPIVDARGGRVFYGVYKRLNNNLVNIEKDNLIYFDELLEQLKDNKDKIVFVGDIDKNFQDKILLNSRFSIAPSSLNNCIGRSICDLASNIDSNELNYDYLNLKPEYIRKSQAQIDLEKRNKKC